VRSLERRVSERLAELEPLVAEYRELREVAARLGLEVAGEDAPALPPGGRSEKRPPPDERKPAARAPRVSARDVDRPARVARLVADRPGITVAEVARELGVDATGLYRVVRRLEQRGQVRKDGTGLHPVAER